MQPRAQEYACLGPLTNHASDVYIIILKNVSIFATRNITWCHIPPHAGKPVPPIYVPSGIAYSSGEGGREITSRQVLAPVPVPVSVPVNVHNLASRSVCSSPTMVGLRSGEDSTTGELQPHDTSAVRPRDHCNRNNSIAYLNTTCSLMNYLTSTALWTQDSIEDASLYMS